MEVVGGRKHGTERFFGLEKVVEVAQRMMRARVAGATFVDWLPLLLECGVPQIQPPLPCEHGAVARRRSAGEPHSWGTSYRTAGNQPPHSWGGSRLRPP